ncbi:uncharacterized protein [Onthophagus taurus]|uniref:uncharacterized protein n=1 Tax=Onthophagus taurus TaxID=166361 RepID=UPI000C1FD8C6|nr:uncharacterized protein LOC111426090 [Onthophagus taurus]
MKVFVVLAVVGLFWSASALPNQPRDEDCKAVISSAAYDGDMQIIVSFTPKADCSAAGYKVKYTIGGEDGSVNAMPGASLGIIALDAKLFCEDVTITIIAIGADGTDIVESESDPETVIRYMPEIEVIDTKQEGTTLTITYEKIDTAYIDTCGATFKVSIAEASGPVDCENGECNLDLEALGLMACTNYIATIVTEANNLKGQSVDVPFNYKPKGVDNVDIVSDEIGIIFTPLAEDDISSSCITPGAVIQYKIIEEPGTCFKNSYTVFPVMGENEGQGKEIEIQNKPTAVEDLAAQISSGYVVLKWNPPSDGESCNLVYKGEDKDNNVLFSDTHITTASVAVSDLHIEDCKSTTISIYAQIEQENDSLLDGSPAKIEIPGRVEKVTSLDCKHENDEVSCSWVMPEQCDGSDLEYNLTYYDGVSVHSEKIKELTHTYKMNCNTASWFIVTPVYKTISVGEITEFEVPTC